MRLSNLYSPLPAASGEASRLSSARLGRCKRSYVTRRVPLERWAEALVGGGEDVKSIVLLGE